MTKKERLKSRIEAWRAFHIGRSQTFVVCMFLGHGQYDKREASSLQKARTIRRRMIREYASERVMIYAVTPDGVSIPVY